MGKIIKFPTGRRVIERLEESGHIGNNETAIAWIQAMKAQLKGESPDWPPNIEIKIKR